MKFTLKQVADFVGGNVEGDLEATVSSLGKIEEATTTDLTFLANTAYEEYIYTTKAIAVMVSQGFKPKKKITTNLIRVENPYFSFTQILEKYQQMTSMSKVGVESPSFISPSATLGKDTFIGAFVYIADQCKIAKDVKIYPNSYIGDNCEIGEGTIIHAGVKIYPNTSIGKHCVIHAGAVIGSDGFGFAPNQDGIYKAIPQIGKTIIEDHVSIGANTTIDRATMGATIIKEGAKLDNLIQIAHNVVIGKNTVMAAQVGIAGSTKIGDDCQFGGQSAVAGHLTVANKTTLGGKAATISPIIEPNQFLVGQPAQSKEAMTSDLINIKRIPKIQKQIKELKEKIVHLMNDPAKK